MKHYSVVSLLADRNSWKVKPGSYITCDSTGYVEHINYWDLDYPDKVGLRVVPDGVAEAF